MIQGYLNEEKIDIILTGLGKNVIKVDKEITDDDKDFIFEKF